MYICKFYWFYILDKTCKYNQTWVFIAWLVDLWQLSWQWFLRKRILNFVKAFSLFHYHLPIENARGSSLKPIWFPITQKGFVVSLVEIGQAVLKILKLRQCISLFCYYLPLKKDMDLHLKLQLNHLHPRILVIVKLKLA